MTPKAQVTKKKLDTLNFVKSEKRKSFKGHNEECEMVSQQRKAHRGWLLSLGNSPRLLKEELAPSLLKLLKKMEGQESILPDSFLVDNKTYKVTSKTKLQTTFLNMDEKCLKGKLNPNDQMNTHLDQEPSPQGMQNCFNVCRSLHYLPPFSMGTSQQTMSRHPWVNVKGLKASTQWRYTCIPVFGAALYMIAA